METKVLNPKLAKIPVSHGFTRSYVSSTRPDLTNTTPPAAQENPPNDQEALKFAYSEIDSLKRLYRYDLKKWMTKARWEGLFRNQQLKLLKASEPEGNIHSWLSDLNLSGRFKSALQDGVASDQRADPVTPPSAYSQRRESKTSSEVPSFISHGEIAPDLTKPISKAAEEAREINLGLRGASRGISSATPSPSNLGKYLGDPLEAVPSNDPGDNKNGLIFASSSLSNLGKLPSKVEQDPSPLVAFVGNESKVTKSKPIGVKTPRSKETVVIQYGREATVKSWVLNEAKGICECCRKKAPFKTAEGQPYLEVHHVREISKGGSDTTTNSVAICPNCHRELHFGTRGEALKEKLYKTVSRLVRE